jgi:hypothetical protein
MQQQYNCPNCSAQVAYGEPFCRNCGTPFTWEALQTPQPPQSYDQQQYNQQQEWGQQQDWGQQQPPGQTGWNQPPPNNQQAGWGYPNQYQQQYGYGRPGAQVKKKKPINRVNLALILIAIIVIIGGVAYAATSLFPSGKTGVPPEEETPETVAAPAKPPDISFSVSPTTIRRGQSATLTWNVIGATNISIDQGVGTVSANGTKSVIPTQDNTTYVLTATNETAYMTKSVTVTISEPVVPVVNNFSASPGMISAGQTSALQWNVTGATSIFIDNDIGPVSASGSRDMNPSQTTTYILTATNREGTVTKSVTVNVSTSGVPVIATFTATPSNITAGEISTLEWKVTGATSVSLGGITVISSGTKEVTPAQSTTYNLTARNNIGIVTAKAVVTVGTATVPVINSFYANPTTTYSGAATLYWDVIGATTISINQGVGTMQTASGNVPVTVMTPTIFTLTATNTTGSTTRSITVNKGTTPVVTFTADTPTPIGGGEYTTTLHWTAPEADTVSIDHGVGQQASISCQVTLSATTIYTLTATNGAGSSTATVTVTIPPP